jgi:hypothetical protein
MRLAVDTCPRRRRLGRCEARSSRASGHVGGRWSNGSVVAVLTAINMWLGVLLSLTGSIAVAPQAVPQLWKLAKHDARQVRGLLARVLPFLRKSVTVHAGTATGTVSFGGVATGTASGKVTHNGPTEEQVKQLWRELDFLREDLGKLRTETNVRAKAIEKTVEDLSRKSSEWHQDLLRRIQQAEEEQTEFNARALPLIGFGIVLTAAASWLAERPLWVNVVAIAAVLTLSIRVVGPIVRRGWGRWRDKRRVELLQSEPEPGGS